MERIACRVPCARRATAGGRVPPHTSQLGGRRFQHWHGLGAMAADEVVASGSAAPRPQPLRGHLH
eukprot:6203155-Pleurochrysis_carterae.AAC.1